MAWSSVDGRVWQRVQHDAVRSTSGPPGDDFLVGVAGVGSEFIAFGSEAGLPVIWRAGTARP